MTWDWDFAWSVMPDLLSGFLVSIEASLLASFVALGLGLVWAVLRYAKVPFVSPIVGLCVEFVRGTPLLVQLFFLFYVLPRYGLTLSPFVTGFIGLGLNFSAYAAEVYRAGLESVPRGQWEAATVLGLPARRRWLGVILPQAIRNVVPPLGNYVVLMFKESAILSAITVADVVHQANSIGSEQFRYTEPLTLVALLFLAVSYPAARAIRRLETRLERFV